MKYDRSKTMEGIMEEGQFVGHYDFSSKLLDMLCEWLTNKGHPTDYGFIGDRKMIYTFSEDPDSIISIFSRLSRGIAKEMRF